MKDAIVAKLASQCDEFYSEAMKQMQNSRSIRDGDWIPRVSAKQAGYHAIAQYFQSRVCNANKLIGEEIGRLQLQFYRLFIS